MIAETQITGSLIKTIHQPGSITEVYFDNSTSTVHEVKCLRNNRCKTYSFPLSQFPEKRNEYNLAQ